MRTSASNLPSSVGDAIGAIYSLSEDEVIGDVYIFGSVLTKDYPNDIDIILIVDEYVVPPHAAYKKALPMIEGIERATFLPVDLTILTKAELYSSEFTSLVSAVLIRSVRN